MKQKKAMKCWVTRDNWEHSGPSSVVRLWRRKPENLAPKRFADFNDPNWQHIDSFCHGDFTRFTGLDVEPGDCLRIQIHVEVLSGGKE